MMSPDDLYERPCACRWGRQEVVPFAPITSPGNGVLADPEDEVASISRSVLTMDLARRILTVNSSARRTLAAGVVLTMRDGRLGCISPVHERHLSSAISQLLHLPAANGSTAPGVQVPVHLVTAEPARTLLGCLCLVRNAAAILRLSLVPLRDDAEVDSALAIQLFGLTRAEARLARRIMSGRELSEIAAELHLSLETTRTHLKALFAKTGTHRQAELVSLLLRLNGC